jgi:hypothetical protein
MKKSFIAVAVLVLAILGIWIDNYVENQIPGNTPEAIALRRFQAEKLPDPQDPAVDTVWTDFNRFATEHYVQISRQGLEEFKQKESYRRANLLRKRQWLQKDEALLSRFEAATSLFERVTKAPDCGQTYFSTGSTFDWKFNAREARAITQPKFTLEELHYLEKKGKLPRVKLLGFLWEDLNFKMLPGMYYGNGGGGGWESAWGHYCHYLFPDEKAEPSILENFRNPELDLHAAIPIASMVDAWDLSHKELQAWGFTSDEIDQIERARRK